MCPLAHCFHANMEMVALDFPCLAGLCVAAVLASIYWVRKDAYNNIPGKSATASKFRA